MARMIPAAERVTRARALIQKARDLPVVSEFGWQDFSYVAQVKDILQQARDLGTHGPASQQSNSHIFHRLSFQTISGYRDLHKSSRIVRKHTADGRLRGVPLDSGVSR